MYACIHEIGSGFFGEVCRLEDRPLTFATYPRRPSTKRKVRERVARCLHSADSKGGPDNADTLTNGKG
jgi:hypothetical protein